VKASTDTSEPTLVIQGMSSGYDQATVLREIDLVLRRGEVTALLGPNGAGKTTLIKTVAGELRPQSGTIELAGRHVTAHRPERRARAGLCTIPEGRGVFPSLTVRDNLRLHQVAGSRRASIDAALEVFPALKDRQSQLAGSMSGGQQQQLALARCFTTRPSVVLLDEVSMGLSPIVIDEIFAAIERLAAAGVALLLVEQYVTRALAMADQVVVLVKGELAFAGPAASVDADELTQRYLA